MDSKELKIMKKLEILAIIYAVATIWMGDYIVSILTNRSYDFIEQFSPRMIQTVLIYVPFGALLICRKIITKTNYPKNIFNGLMSAYVGGGIASILLWGYYFYDGYTYIVYEKSGGANIGLGIILIASPILISSLMCGCYFIGLKYIHKDEN